jgi:methionyl-tRNA formyltransferase
MVLCGRSPRHLYVANSLCAVAEVVAIIHETGSAFTWKKLFRTMQPGNLFPKVGRWLRERGRNDEERERRFFFCEAPARLAHPELVREFPHVNHPDVLALTRRLKPDLMCVFGTSLIRGDLLKEGRLGIVNLHGGLSPDYRGADCTFWALYNREPEKVGCTLHWIDAGIDTGGLIAHISPEIRPDDDERTLFWRAVKTSAAVYAELVRRLGEGERFGQRQPHKGRLYQVKQRRARHERTVDRSLKDGLLRNLELGRRVTWFTLSAGPDSIK